MGGQSSKSSKKSNPYAQSRTNIQTQHYDSKRSELSQRQTQQPEEDVEVSPKSSGRNNGGYSSSDDEFYDGIPRFRRSSSRSRRTKVSEMAAEMFDTLGNSMANLHSGSNFVSGSTAKNNELSILAFEVANTIVKGANILQSLSKRSIRLLMEAVLPSEGVQKLVSTNMDELLKIVAADKREELKIFAGEVVRFGNRCKDPQWHNLDLYFKKHIRDSQKQMREEAELIMQQLMILVHHTAELYQELHAVDRFKQEFQHKHIEVSISNAMPRGNSPAILAGELKTQRKLVKSLKKKSLWSRSMEEVMEKLVDIVLFLNQEITNVFKITVNDDNALEVVLVGSQQRLGPSGLALHYANIILMIDSIVARSSSIPQGARETLYQSLPPSIKSPLRSKLHSFHVEDQLTVAEIKAEMEKTLQWLAPIATNTAKAHHGFGWVGEWANSRSESNRQSGGPNDLFQIDTLHHANRQKTEAYVFELLLWLNYLVKQSSVVTNGGKPRSSTKASYQSSLDSSDSESRKKSAISSLVSLSTEDQKMLPDVNDERHIQGTGKCEKHDYVDNGHAQVIELKQ